MKRIISMFLIFIMTFSFSLNALAWDGVDWWNNLASEEIRTNAPQAATPSHQRNMMLYNNKDGLYYKIQNTGTASGNNSYYINSSSCIVYQTGNQNTFEIFKYENSVWSQVSLEDGTKVFETYDLSDFLLVSNTAKVFIDDTSYSFSPETGELIVDGEVIEKPTEEPEPPVYGEDITNSGLLSGLKNFFEGLLEGILDLIDFIWEIIKKIGDLLKSLYETLLKVPELIFSVDSLFGEESAIFSFLNNVFPENNETAQNCKFIVILIFSYGVFMFFYTLIKKFLLK